MFCNACGKTISEDAVFCTYCGVRVGAAAAGAAPRGPGLFYRLERPRNGRWIAGVCAAVAHGLEMDVTLVRILWLCLSILGAGFPGFIAYVICWIVIPQQSLMLPQGYVASPTGSAGSVNSPANGSASVANG